MRILLLLLIVSTSLHADDRHWAFVPPVRSVSGSSIDEFIQKSLKSKGLAMAPEAERRVLLRRVSYDLTGLPPTFEEVKAFQDDKSPDAFEKVVNRLIASPHFGERWAQHWLDVVRFAESNGYELDGERSHAWRYRDYVVKSFNDDKPYDRFLTEQLAGDEMTPHATPVRAAELWIATGLHRCGPSHVVGGNLDREMVRRERLTETLTGLGAIMGVTLHCTRCHDHKFDPFSQADYYSLEAFFAATTEKEIDLADAQEKRAFNTEFEAVQAKLEPLKKELESLEKPYRDKLTAEKKAALPETLRMALAIPAKDRTPEQAQQAKHAGILLKVLWEEVLEALTPADRAKRDRLKQTMRDLEATLPPPMSKAMAIKLDKPVPTHVLKRGDYLQKKELVSATVPEVFDSKMNFTNRRDLAKWLTQPTHPLTARVMVNRLWQHYFGRGLVGTPNDFGTRGDKPSHPELLDWLALELAAPEIADDAWKLKRIHKMIVMSQAYRQSSRVENAEAMKLDPDNRLLWRQNRKRLDGEAIRDSILAAAGTLNRAVGGRSVKVPLEPEVYDLIFTEHEPDNLWPVTPDTSQHTRRSLYLFNKRNVRQPLLEAYDQPDTLTPCGTRGRSTFAPQALILMNGALSREMAPLTAKRCHSVESVYRRCLQRDPTAAEVAIAENYLKSGTLAEFALAIFNINEFAYLP